MEGKANFPNIKIKLEKAILPKPLVGQETSLVIIVFELPIVKTATKEDTYANKDVFL